MVKTSLEGQRLPHGRWEYRMSLKIRPLMVGGYRKQEDEDPV